MEHDPFVILGRWLQAVVSFIIGIPGQLIRDLQQHDLIDFVLLQFERVWRAVRGVVEWIAASIVGVFGAFALLDTEWTREFKRDAKTALDQLGRDWQRLQSFIGRNGNWVFATVTGGIGLSLTVMLMLTGLSGSVRNAMELARREQQFVRTSFDVTAINSRMTTPHMIQPTAFVAVADDAYPVQIEVAGAVPRRQWDPEPMRQREPVYPAPRTPSIRRNPAVSFEPLIAQAEPLLEIEVEGSVLRESASNQTLIDESEEFVVRSRSAELLLEPDLELVLGLDDWSSFDRNRADLLRHTLSLRERFGELELSGHEEQFDPTSPRIVPLARELETAEHVDVTVVKQLPKTGVVDGLLEYRVVVENPGDRTMSDIVVRDEIPPGWRIVDTLPAAIVSARDIVWNLSSLTPGQSRVLHVQAIPSITGLVVGRVHAEVNSSVQAFTHVDDPSMDRTTRNPSARQPSIPEMEFSRPRGVDRESSNDSRSETIIRSQSPTISDDDAVRRPQPIARPLPPTATFEFAIEVHGPREVPVGSRFSLRYVVMNHGRVPTPAAVIQIQLPEHLGSHLGDHVQHHLPALGAGQSHTIELPVVAVREGIARSTADIRTENGRYGLTRARLDVKAGVSGQVRGNVPAASSGSACLCTTTPSA